VDPPPVTEPLDDGEAPATFVRRSLG
jgi:hypothetical protein